MYVNDDAGMLVATCPDGRGMRRRMRVTMAVMCVFPFMVVNIQNCMVKVKN